MKEEIICPNCNSVVATRYKNPTLTVDAIIVYMNKVLLIERKNEPFGWALPGGFVDYGETLEQAAIREVFEETGIKIKMNGYAGKLNRLFGMYDNPNRDPRGHNISAVFNFSIRTNQFNNIIVGDDAKNFKWVSLHKFNNKKNWKNISFDHAKILKEFWYH